MSAALAQAWATDDGLEGDVMRFSPRHYVPVLQDRAGEMDALRRAQRAVWGRMTPVIVVVGPKTGLLTQGAASGRAKRVADALGDHAFFVDTLRVNRAQGVGTTSCLEYVFQRLRGRGARFIPVADLSDPASHRTVGAAAAVDHRGVGLRVRLDRISTSLTPVPTVVATTLAALRVTDEETHLLLDLGYLPPDQDVDVEMVGSIVMEWVDSGAWRTVTVIGTSMPQTLRMVNEGSLGGLPRREWTTWCDLRARGLEVNYGDYAVQHPVPPEDTGPGMRANIRYTLPNRTVIVRGVGPVTQGIGSGAYADLARQLWELPDFATRDYSWGDEVIEECALGRYPRSSQLLWRGAGTSHHLQVVIDQLANLEG